MNDYRCPRQSCCNQRLCWSKSEDAYICYVCGGAYIIGADGRPTLKNPMVKKKKQSKYGNKPVTIDGFFFPSQGEGNYYCQLKLRRKAGDIKWFAMQSRFILQDGKEHIEYRADFIVAENDGSIRVIDFKGVETKEFKIKKKLLEGQYDVKLVIVKA